MPSFLSPLTAKRVFDVVGALVLLIGLAPLLVLVAACIWWDDGRPLVFTQLRAGRDGRPFRIFKFRTLRTGPTNPMRPGDATTRVGDVLRRWALDELPQLWNVLRGDMSLVGPRPTLLRQVEQYGPYESVRLQVRPGLTGWAQIHGRNSLSWRERIDLDREYVHNRSLLLDLRILMWTPRVLTQGVGVYGPNDQNLPFAPYSVNDEPHG